MNNIIWSEGMFLKQQHFQQQNRYYESLINNKTTQIHKNHWGIERLEFDEELLQLGKLQLNYAKGIFKDGTCFKAPLYDLLPQAVNITIEDKGSSLYLGISIRNHQDPSVDLDNNHKTIRFYSDYIKVRDDTTAANKDDEIQISKLNIQLLTDKDDREPYHCIKVGKVDDVDPNGKIKLCRKFIAACMTLHDSDELIKLTKGILSLLEQQAQMLSRRCSSNDNNPQAQISDFMLLQLINRYNAELKFLYSQSTHPQDLYLLCSKLTAEVSTYTTDTRKPDPIKDYNHNAMDESFNGLSQTVRRHLDVVLEQHAKRIDLTRHQHGVWTTESITSDQLESCNIILCVKHEKNSLADGRNLENFIKIASLKSIENIVKRALPGVSMLSLTSAPRQLPHFANARYFMVNTNETYWNEIVEQKNISVHISGGYHELDIELWAIKG